MFGGANGFALTSSRFIVHLIGVGRLGWVASFTHINASHSTILSDTTLPRRESPPELYRVTLQLRIFKFRISIVAVNAA